MIEKNIAFFKIVQIVLGFKANPDLFLSNYV